MTDTAELIARLRDAEVGYRPHVVGKYLAEAADALSSLVRERDEARRVLRDHHKWHAESGILGIPDGDGGWIEMDNGAEYADSRLCQRTEETLRDMPPEFVVPPRGGWAMGSNHWENWQLAYRQKRAAEAERDEARAAHDADAKAFLVAIARVEAVEADAARMREDIAKLSDPNAVHANLLRGSIARPSVAQIIHIYGEDALRAELGGDPVLQALGLEVEK